MSEEQPGSSCLDETVTVRLLLQVWGAMTCGGLRQREEEKKKEIGHGGMDRARQHQAKNGLEWISTILCYVCVLPQTSELQPSLSTPTLGRRVSKNGL